MNVLQLVSAESTGAAPAPRMVACMVDALRRRAAAVPQPAGGVRPAAMAEAVFALSNRHLKHFPGDPDWPDRDRLVFAGAGAAALAQALLQLSGYEAPPVEASRIGRPKAAVPCRFAQAATAGTGTVPLRSLRAAAVVRPRQSLATAVGMAIAERMLAEAFDSATVAVIDHRTYAVVDRSCLAGSAAGEACRLAVERRLARLIVLCEDDGGGEHPDPASFFAGCGWNVIGPLDGHDVDAVDAALRASAASAARPSAIVCRTAFDESSVARSAASGDPPTGGAAAAHTAEDVRSAWDARRRGARHHRDWQRRFAAWQRSHPALAAEFDRRLRRDHPVDYPQATLSLMVQFARSRQARSTRSAADQALRALGAQLPELQAVHCVAQCSPAVLNGLALHGGFAVHGLQRSTRDDEDVDAMRSAARQQQPVVHIVDRGCADATMRSIPHLDVWLPYDAAEAAVAAIVALGQRARPSALIVGEDSCAPHRRTPEQMLAIMRGAYVLADRPDPVAVLLASGPDVAVAMETQRRLDAQGVAARVVSMPCAAVFDRQDAGWRDQVLPERLPHQRIEAGVDAETLLTRLRSRFERMRAA